MIETITGVGTQKTLNGAYIYQSEKYKDSLDVSIHDVIKIRTEQRYLPKVNKYVRSYYITTKDGKRVQFSVFSENEL